MEVARKVKRAGAGALVYSLRDSRYNTINPGTGANTLWFEPKEFAYAGDEELRNLKLAPVNIYAKDLVGFPVCFVSKDVGGDIYNKLALGGDVMVHTLKYQVTLWWN